MAIYSKSIKNPDKFFRIALNQPQKSLSVGETVKAHIIKNLSSGKFLINLNGKNLLAESRVTLPLRKSITLRVISLVPKPMLEVIDKEGVEISEKNLSSTITLVDTERSGESPRNIFNELNQEVSAQVLKVLGENLFSLQIGGKEFKAKTFFPFSSGDKLKLRVLSVFPEPLLEVISFNDLGNEISLANSLFRYFDSKGVVSQSLKVFLSENKLDFLKKSSGNILSFILSALAYSDEKDLMRGDTWFVLLEILAKNYKSDSGDKTSVKNKSTTKQQRDLSSMLQDINTSASSENKILWAIPFPISNELHWVDAIISKPSSKTHGDTKNGSKDSCSAIIRLDTGQLGKLEIRLQLKRTVITAVIFGSLSHTVRIIQENLEDLRTILKDTGFQIARLEVILKSDILSAEEKIIDQLFPEKSTGMNIVI